MKVHNMYLWLIFSAFFFSNSSAQIKAYKLKNGSKTEITAGQELTIELSGEGKQIDNILYEIDIKKFKEANKYDIITITIGRNPNDYWNETKIELTSDLALKKYSNLDRFSIYAFENNSYVNKHGNFFVFPKNYSILEKYFQDVFYIKIVGFYKKSEETYYDDFSSSVKTRNIYDEGQEISRFEFKYIQNQAAKDQAIDIKYQKFAANDFEGARKEYIVYCKNRAERLREIKSDAPIVSSYVSISKYKNIAQAVEEIGEYYFNILKNEKDKVKAVQLHDEWINTQRAFFCLENKLNDQAKKLEKELKTATTVEEKIALFKSY